jgi:hypothetical protein
MKKFLLVTFSAICISIIIPCKIYAIDVSVGATTWYSWWDNNALIGENSEADPAFLYGPSLAVQFNDDFGLTFVYLYGKYDFTGEVAALSYKAKVKRSDADLALNYKLNDFFKVFAGVKYLSSSTSGIDWSSWGPELGLSAAYPIAENLSILANLSGFYLWGSNEDDHHTHPSGSGHDGNHKDYGFNSGLSFAYYIAPASTTVSLGGRFQYVKENNNDDSYSYANKFYGVTLTATYSFSL